MKVALLIALSADQRTGQPVSSIIPQDDAIRLFKEAVTAGQAPSKDFPVLEVWTRTDGRSKSQRFDPAKAGKLKPASDGKRSPKVKELEASLEAAKGRIAELEARLSELSQPPQQESEEPCEPGTKEGDAVELPEESPLAPQPK